MCIEHLLLLSFALDAKDGGRLILQHVEKRKCPGLTWAKRTTRRRQEGAIEEGLRSGERLCWETGDLLREGDT